MELLDDRTGGWRRFAVLPETVSWMRVRRHFTAMPGANLVDLACDRMNEAALIFVYEECRFAVDLEGEQFRFSVENPECPDAVLREVLQYAAQLMGKRAS